MSVFTLDPVEIGRHLKGELVVVMPVYNEEANIRAVFDEWRDELARHTQGYVFVVIDDGSVDGTRALLEAIESRDPARVVVVRKPNSGHGNSCRTGYDIASAGNGEWILQIDSDGQCDPAYFAEFWRCRNEADCVFGERRSRDDGRARIATSLICRIGASAIGGVALRDPNVPYRLLRRGVLKEALDHIPPGFNIHNVALTFALRRTPGLRWAYVPIHFRDRQGGRNSINLLNVIQWGAEMLLELWKLKRRLRAVRCK